jgi:hypothetical protein
MASPGRPGLQQQFQGRPVSPSEARLLPPASSRQSHSGSEESAVRPLQRVFTRFCCFLATRWNVAYSMLSSIIPSAHRIPLNIKYLTR